MTRADHEDCQRESAGTKQPGRARAEPVWGEAVDAARRPGMPRMASKWPAVLFFSLSLSPSFAIGDDVWARQSRMEQAHKAHRGSGPNIKVGRSFIPARGKGPSATFRTAASPASPVSLHPPGSNKIESVSQSVRSALTSSYTVHSNISPLGRKIHRNSSR